MRAGGRPAGKPCATPDASGQHKIMLFCKPTAASRCHCSCIVVLQAAGSHGTQCYQAPKHKRGNSVSEALSWQQRLGFTCQIAGQRGQLGTQRWVLQQQHIIHGNVHTQRLILKPWV